MTKEKLLYKRHRFNKIIAKMGVAAISIATLFLFVFISSIIIQAIPAFTMYKISIPYNDLEKIDYSKFLSDDANNTLNTLPKQENNQAIELLASAELNDFLKGSDTNYFNEQDKLFIQDLLHKNLISKKFNIGFFINTESRSAEIAGIATSVIGTLYTITICLLFSIPIAVCSAIYLEEFAPKNMLTSLIEVNINNLAAVPSIVFGLLGLSILINFFDLERSTPMVGGITLAMMVLPIMIISTRRALLAIPVTIKHAALALGATRIQVILHHSLPLALPGIMTGIILSLARAMGETAPLILLGMVAFIVDIPHSVFDPATVMPVQIFLWTQNPENAFHAKTAAAILVLLSILIILNIIAVYIRKKYEHRW